MNINKIISTSLISLSLIPLVGSINPVVYAADDNYGGGKTEVVLKIEKEVKLDGDSNYKDKVFIDLTDKNERAKTIWFRITVTNLKDEAKNLKMEDFLPSALNKVSGDLTEEWSTLKKDESITFEIKANLKPSEIKEDKDYEKCVVNKAEIRREGNFAGSDVATVCYGNEPTSPETGVLPMAGFAGLGMFSLGSLLKLSNKKPKVKK